VRSPVLSYTITSGFCAVNANAGARTRMHMHAWYSDQRAGGSWGTNARAQTDVA
jgi:hypothetical protein